MSRQIDLSQPLSDEDRAYLEARGRTSDILRADNPEGWTESTLTGGDPVESVHYESLGFNTGDANPVPPDQRAQVWGPPAEAVGEDETALVEIGQTGGQVLDYTQFTKAQLVEEIEKRNEANGEDYLSKSGNKAELSALLTADDAGELDADEDGEEPE